jgi:hypothetical protein
MKNLPPISGWELIIIALFIGVPLVLAVGAVAVVAFVVIQRKRKK